MSFDYLNSTKRKLTYRVDLICRISLWKWIIIFTTFILCVIAGLLILHLSLKDAQNNEITSALNVAERISSKFQQKLDSSCLSAYSLIAAAIAELRIGNTKTQRIGNISYTYLPEFYNSYGEFIRSKFQVDALQFSENGVITHVVPFNVGIGKGAIGIDIPKSKPEQWKQLIERNTLTLVGPYVLIQSPSVTFVVRYPMFINGTWWSSTVITLVDNILESPEVQLDKIWDDGYQYSLKHTSIDTKEFVEVRSYINGILSKTIRPNTELPCDDKVMKTINLPGHTLYLHIFPRRCWIKTTFPLINVAVIIICSFVIAALALLSFVSGNIFKLRRNNRILAKAPGGLVTLVFTDVQNSTELWSIDSYNMHLMLSLHNETLRRLLQKYSGYEVKTQGDSFMVAFYDAVSALNWCCEVQYQLLYIDWPSFKDHPAIVNEYDTDTGAPLFCGLRVRMGVHTGYPDPEVDPVTSRVDYFGSDVNYAARIEALGNGGQILISRTTFDQIKESAFEIILMGDFMLKGFDEPQNVYQIIIPKLENRVYGPLRSSDQLNQILSSAINCIYCSRPLHCSHCNIDNPRTSTSSRNSIRSKPTHHPNASY